MEQTLDLKLEHYQKEVIPVFDYLPNNYIRFKKLEQGNKKFKIIILLDDDTLNTSTYIGEYNGGKWKFINRNDSSLFWSLIKSKNRYKHFLRFLNRIKLTNNSSEISIGRKIRRDERRRKIKRFFKKLFK